jgi:hypothetical protein
MALRRDSGAGDEYIGELLDSLLTKGHNPNPVDSRLLEWQATVSLRSTRPNLDELLLSRVEQSGAELRQHYRRSWRSQQSQIILW